MALDASCGQVIAVVTTPRGKSNLCILHGKWLQDDSLGPVQRAVALGLDDGFLGRPGNDMGSTVIRRNELFFLVIEELVTHSQHLLTVNRSSAIATSPIVWVMLMFTSLPSTDGAPCSV